MSAPTTSMELKSVRVVAGCRSLGIVKGLTCPVESVTELGAEYSHSVKLVLKIGSRRVALYARHPNRVAEGTFHLNNGNPFKRITVTRAA